MLTGLESISIFNDLELSQLEKISAFCERLQLVEGDVLISENDHSSNDLYVLCNGHVEIISNGSGVTSGDVPISKQDKEIFGEISWLTSGKRTATIRCVDEVEAIRIDGQKLSRYLEQNPDAGFAVTRRIALLLAQRMDQTDNLLKQVLWNSNI
jgi:CRP/FNR family cyclic AMP-dependent transcriptional regulator